MNDKNESICFSHACPFNSPAYLSALTNLGELEVDINSEIPLLRRPIPGTTLYDGVGAWPYCWINSSQNIEDFIEHFSHLVTITIVAQPGFLPMQHKEKWRLFKQHFVYDPRLPMTPLSPRASARLRQCEKTAEFRITTDYDRWLQMTLLYEKLKIRRNLSGSYVNFTPGHFEQIAKLNEGVFFEVANSNGIGAMACGVLFKDMLQILHIASSDNGLSWNASYLLMSGLQKFSRKFQLRLLTGGVPENGSSGLASFKTRWANTLEPVYILRIINDHQQYAELCIKHGTHRHFFPAYRSPDAASAPL
jgi:hypothetical protein